MPALSRLDTSCGCTEVVVHAACPYEGRATALDVALLGDALHTRPSVDQVTGTITVRVRVPGVLSQESAQRAALASVREAAGSSGLRGWELSLCRLTDRPRRTSAS